MLRLKSLSRVGYYALSLLTASFAITPAALADGLVQFADQGSNWGRDARKIFYSRDQGARVIPYAWIAALKLPNGKGFLDDGLARYGYLANPDADTPGLPVGFQTAKQDGVKTLGINCAACHTRQIEVNGVAWRIDGGPALTDFQRFLADLDSAVIAATASDAAFKEFADRVLGQAADETSRLELRAEVDAWFLPYHTIMKKALPNPGWGIGRADAVGMIFNRVAGLDIGAGPTHIIEDNIQPADAPVRYPFVFNAPFLDFTQWPGFAKNGDDVLALARNLGEVFGVFGVYHPEMTDEGVVNFRADGFSANFSGLMELESLLRRMGPPKWPWKIDAALAAKGKEIFDRDPAQGGCGPGCHELKPGAERLLTPTWATPILDVGTDSREYSILARTALTGELEGATVPPIIPTPLGKREPIINILGMSVIGSIAQNPIGLLIDFLKDPQRWEEFKTGGVQLTRPSKVVIQLLKDSLKDVFDKEIAKLAPNAPPVFKYESKVMQGIWAAAPYLHNGSVPSLAELLKPPAERVQSFKVGPAYDIENVGLAKEQTKFDYVYETTGCDQRDSGNSRCGHDFGTKLSADEKKALLEYLKQL